MNKSAYESSDSEDDITSALLSLIKRDRPVSLLHFFENCISSVNICINDVLHKSYVTVVFINLNTNFHPSVGIHIEGSRKQPATQRCSQLLPCENLHFFG